MLAQAVGLCHHGHPGDWLLQGEVPGEPSHYLAFQSNDQANWTLFLLNVRGLDACLPKKELLRSGRRLRPLRLGRGFPATVLEHHLEPASLWVSSSNQVLTKNHG
jgi:hypothetical protein